MKSNHVYNAVFLFCMCTGVRNIIKSQSKDLYKSVKHGLFRTSFFNFPYFLTFNTDMDVSSKFEQLSHLQET